MQENKTKRNVILPIVLVLVLIVAVVGVSYSIFNWSSQGTKENVITTGSMECTFNEGTPISITAAHPITDDTGKVLSAGAIDGYTQGYYDATLSCTCNGACKGDYEIYAQNTSDEANALDPQFVKTYVTDGSETETALDGVTAFSSLANATANAEDKVIHADNFDSSFTQKIRLRLWVSDQYVVTNQSANFKAKLHVKVNG